ncbi:type 1 glutamine amidotransferase [Salinigranum marinum]|uniref:type 1 glutamine amidotransferase n=1 Tax=Salinigranum marinum TaxID=1515595 RepID=UPI00298A073E|nr:type 1 glutamine amidotransferase [Salinigranum marinum]
MDNSNEEVDIALLDASLGDTPAERNLRRELDGAVTVFKLSDGESPPAVGAEFPFDAAVISGSQTSVYDDESWIAETEAWVREAVESGLPVLGVCWGHQLLAQALGGDVDPMGSHELGYAAVDLIDDDPLFDGFDASFVAFETHSDEVTRLPAAASVLAENDRALQAFRIRNAWGVQFHPEYDLGTARWVTENKRGQLTDAAVDAILDTITPARHAETADATRVFDNFLAFARRTRSHLDVRS